ncbi:LOW QUALITY PROTEIN: actin, muscle-like [Alca torda]
MNTFLWWKSPALPSSPPVNALPLGLAKASAPQASLRALCYGPLDPTQEMKAKPEEIMKEYRLPHNNIIQAGNRLFPAPEIFFVPANIGVEAPGVHKMIFNTIMKHGIGMLRNLYASGGSRLFPGLEWILKEMKLQVPAGMFVRVGPSAPKRKYCVWTGTSILTCLTSLKQMWVTVSNNKDFGAAVSCQKCF